MFRRLFICLYLETQAAAIFYPTEGSSGLSETTVLAYRITRFHDPESNNMYSLTRRGVRRAS